jgi:predicted RNA-binding protein with PUA domain
VQLGPVFALADAHCARKVSWRGLGKLIDVVLRNHYTCEENMASIHKNVLMKKEERAAQHIEVVQENGNSYGPGIYHGAYGDVGLLVVKVNRVHLH